MFEHAAFLPCDKGQRWLFEEACLRGKPAGRQYERGVYMSEDRLQRNYARRQEYLRKQRLKRRRRNRILIVSVGIIILLVLILMIVGIVRGCGTSSGGEEQKAAAQAETEPTTTAALAPTQAATQQPSQPQVREIEDNGEDGHMSGGIYIWDNKGFELFFGEDDSAKTYAQRISDYKKALGNDITVYNMVVPNHTEFGLPSRLSEQLLETGETKSQRQNMSAVFDNYTQDVEAVDIYDVLNAHKTEYIYFNTDHHWTGLGAYYAYTAFAETAGLTPLSLEDAQKQTIEPFVGSLYTISGDSALNAHPDSVDYYVFPGEYTCSIPAISEEPLDIYYPNAEPGSNAYGVFIWGDNPLTVIDNQEDTSGKKIALIKESYGNAFAPYLAYNYDEVHVIDFRYYEGNLKQYCQDNNITEVLFLNGIMSANTPLQLDSMDSLFS